MRNGGSPVPANGRLAFRSLGVCAAGLLIAAVALSVGVGTALASCSPPNHTQAAYVRGVGRDNGTRSYISGTATNNSCGMVWFSVAVQSITPWNITDPGDMMQAGDQGGLQLRPRERLQ